MKIVVRKAFSLAVSLHQGIFSVDDKSPTTILTNDIVLGLALLTLSWDENWDSHSLVNGYSSFYPRIALVAHSPGDKMPSYDTSRE